MLGGICVVGLGHAGLPTALRVALPPTIQGKQLLVEGKQLGDK